MKSSNTSSWDSEKNQKHSRELGIAGDALITNSTRDLVEFYWTNRKRFSGGYRDFPSITH